MTRAIHRLALSCLAVATALTLAGCQRGLARAPDLPVTMGCCV
jgi:hypothetical protein